LKTGIWNAAKGLGALSIDWAVRIMSIHKRKGLEFAVIKMGVKAATAAANSEFRGNESRYCSGHPPLRSADDVRQEGRKAD
jgi:hypothetical protein